MAPPVSAPLGLNCVWYSEATALCGVGWERGGRGGEEEGEGEGGKGGMIPGRVAQRRPLM